MRIEAEKKNNAVENSALTEKQAVGEDASIYKSRQNRDENLKLRDLKGKDKWEYFRDYYLLKLVIILVLVGIAVSMVISFVKPKEEVLLSVAIVDNPMLMAEVDEFEKLISDELVSEPEKQLVSVDSNIYTDGSYGAYALMKITTLINSGDLDVMILPYDKFVQQLNGGSVAPLEYILDSETIDSLSEYVITETPYDEDISTGDRTYYQEGRFGLSFNDYLYSKGYSPEETGDGYVLCFTPVDAHKEACRKLITLLY